MTDFQSYIDSLKNKVFDDSAYLKRQAELEAEQEAERKEAELKLWKLRGVTERYLNETWDTFIADTPKKQLALKTVREKAWNKNLLFIGNNGTGKTHFAMCLAKEGATYRKFTDICDEVFEDSQAIKYYGERKLLVIDEVGRQKISEFKIDTLFEIIDLRWNNVLPTTIITNLKTEEFVKTYGKAIIDRLRPVEVLFDWESHRR